MAENEEKKEEKKLEENDEIKELKRAFKSIRGICQIGLILTVLTLIALRLGALKDVPFVSGLANLVKYGFWFSLIGWYLTYSIKVVKEYEEILVMFFGKYLWTLKAGPKFVLWPFMTVRFVKMWEVELDIEPQEVITKDNAVVTVDGLLNARIYNAYKSAFNVEDVFRMMSKIAQTHLRNKVAEFTLDEVNQEREKLNDEVLKLVNIDTGFIDKDGEEKKYTRKQKKEGWGTKGTRVRVKRVDPPDDIQRAMHLLIEANRKMQARVMEGKGEKEYINLVQEALKESKDYLTLLFVKALEKDSKFFFDLDRLPALLKDGLAKLSK